MLRPLTHGESFFGICRFSGDNSYNLRIGINAICSTRSHSRCLCRVRIKEARSIVNMNRDRFAILLLLNRARLPASSKSVLEEYLGHLPYSRVSHSALSTGRRIVVGSWLVFSASVSRQVPLLLDMALLFCYRALGDIQQNSGLSCNGRGIWAWRSCKGHFYCLVEKYYVVGRLLAISVN